LGKQKKLVFFFMFFFVGADILIKLRSGEKNSFTKNGLLAALRQEARMLHIFMV
jgi:hypothetical protein